MPANRSIIEIDDGTREYTIMNKYGQTICTIRFRPSDMSILDRINGLQDKMTEITKELQSIDITANGTSDDMQGYEILKRAEKRMSEEICNIFDSQDIMKIFENRSMFSSVGGEFFVTQVIAKIVDVVADEIGEETKKSQERISKYRKKKA